MKIEFGAKPSTLKRGLDVTDWFATNSAPLWRTWNIKIWLLRELKHCSMRIQGNLIKSKAQLQVIFIIVSRLPEIGVQDFRKNVQYTYYIHGSSLLFLGRTNRNYWLILIINLGVLPFAILIVCHANIHRNFKFILTTEE